MSSCPFWRLPLFSSVQLLRFLFAFHSFVTDLLQSDAPIPEGESEVIFLRHFFALFCLFCSAMAGVPAFGQAGTGAISGIVQANTSAVVPGAVGTLQIPGIPQPVTATPAAKGQQVCPGHTPATSTVPSIRK